MASNNAPYRIGSSLLVRQDQGAGGSSGLRIMGYGYFSGSTERWFMHQGYRAPRANANDVAEFDGGPAVWYLTAQPRPTYIGAAREEHYDRDDGLGGWDHAYEPGLIHHGEDFVYAKGKFYDLEVSGIPRDTNGIKSSLDKRWPETRSVDFAKRKSAVRPTINFPQVHPGFFVMHFGPYIDGRHFGRVFVYKVGLENGATKYAEYWCFDRRSYGPDVRGNTSPKIGGRKREQKVYSNKFNVSVWDQKPGLLEQAALDEFLRFANSLGSNASVSVSACVEYPPNHFPVDMPRP